ncbi:MAG: ferrous iron transport protein A [Bacteroidales bacterium]|nr:ferrous iron transport protein A [Bacteroidales bacterium]
MEEKKDQLSLIELKDGEAGIIVSVHGGKMLTKRLADLGLSPGVEIRILRKTFFSGPVQVEVFGSRLVLGRGLASKILVEPK